jgi:hypothetical protein
MASYVREIRLKAEMSLTAAAALARVAPATWRAFELNREAVERRRERCEEALRQLEELARRKAAA